MSARASRQACTAAQVLLRSNTPQPPIAGPSSHRSIHGPTPARRAAFAYADQQPHANSYEAPPPRHDYYEDLEGYDEPLSAEMKEDLERALHPAWETLGTEKQWEDEGREVGGKEEVYHDVEASAEDEADALRDWQGSLAREAKGKKKVEQHFKTKKEPPIPPFQPQAKPIPEKERHGSTRHTDQDSPKGDSPIHPYISLSPDHGKPLLSRNDWRLSSPVRRPRSSPRTRPPSLYAPIDMTRQGHNKLVGVGVDPRRVGWWSEEMRKEEQWAWKVKTPASEKGSWIAADAHCQRLERLLTLTEKAEEVAYLEGLDRSGTPAEREAQGLTVCQARGNWLTNSSRLDSLAKMSRKDRAAESAKGGSAKAIAAWSAVHGESLGEEAGYRFPPGTVLRFTRIDEEDSEPQPPPSETQRPPQGSLLEVRNGELIVAFKETDMWQLGEEHYRIDIGNDDSSYALQRMAMTNLYYDPARQREHNAEHVASVQEAHGQGVTSIIREWTLTGTDVREHIMPDLDATAEANAARRKEMDPSAELFEDEDSPAAEIAHLPRTNIPPIKPPEGNPSNLLTDNQLIKSWIERHSRDNPMSMTGDPVLNLNASQTKAVAMAMGEKLSLIQGPPGTGKSQTIVSIIALLKLHFRIPQPILLAAPTHVSTDHLLSLLIRAGLNPLRSGKAVKVREDLQAWTLEKRREEHPLWEKLEKAREVSEENRVRLQEFREAPPMSTGARTPEEVQKGLDLEKAYKRAWRQYIAMEQRLYSSLFSTADVFCSTAMGSGASKVMSMIDFPVVFLDEAAMCTEPVTLIPLMKGAEQVTLIGDHKQLPAVVKSREAVKERLHVSLFERLMLEGRVKSVLLDTQYRMRPAISAFSNASFYQSALRDDPSVSTRPPAPLSQYLRPDYPSAFISHSYPESTYRYSTRNEAEADIIVDLVGDLLDRNPALDPADIGVISPYYAQTRLLQDIFSGWRAAQALSDLLGPRRAAQVSRVEVNTVDGFQGREKAIVILSTVRSNAGGNIGFLTDQRRLNVALTRARDAIFVVGNQSTLRRARTSDFQMGDEDADSGVWRRYLNWMEKRNLVVELKPKKGEAVVTPKRTHVPTVEDYEYSTLTTDYY